MEYVHLERANELSREIKELGYCNNDLQKIIDDNYSKSLQIGLTSKIDYVIHIREGQLRLISELLLKLNKERLEVLEKEFKEL